MNETDEQRANRRAIGVFWLMVGVWLLVFGVGWAGLLFIGIGLWKVRP